MAHFCIGADSHVPHPGPIGQREDDKKRHGYQCDDEAGANEISCVECACAVGNHVLRRVHRKDESKAHDELQKHRHSDDVDGRRLNGQQNAHDDGNHRRGESCSARKAEVDDDQKQRQQHQDNEGAGVLKTKVLHNQVCEPAGRIGPQQGRSHTDADREQHDRSPGKAVLRLFPIHHAQARQQHQGDRGDSCRRRVEVVQHFLGRPKAQQYQHYR